MAYLVNSVRQSRLQSLGLIILATWFRGALPCVLR